MIENYIELIMMMDNSFDGIMIVDENLIIRHYKTFSKSEIGYVDEKAAIGKTPFDIFKNITEETSTIYKAVKFKKTTLNNTQIIHYSTGKKEAIVDNTIPIIVNGKVIGAVNTVRYISNFSKNNLSNHSNILAPCLDELYSVHNIIGNSQETNNLKDKILKVSQTDSNVLIYGETGTGKEIVAQSIHSSSRRRDKLFISQNCAAIPNNLLEGILFGTTKGSYTDALNKPGLFEMADGGTIFLDEINSMDLNMQSKLLRVIEEKKITRIGGIEPKKIDVRIIAAINEKPQVCLEQKKLRPDLFYRLSSVQLKTPSLRERREDIKVLAEYFIDFYNQKMDKNISEISQKVIDIFYNYNWPGNVRELKNAVETGFNFTSSNIITLEDIPEYLKELQHTATSKSISNSLISKKDSALTLALETFEKKYIIENSKYATSLSELAKLLKISRQLLNYKIQKYELKEFIKY